LGANSINQKLHAGDRTTPEGLYRITKKKGRGASKYYLALLLDYPNAEDRLRFARAKERGQLTGRTGIGGLIEIHGEGGKGFDWTDGCLAASNEDMQLLYNEARVGTVVAIVGSDGGDGPVRSILRRAERYR
jgi:murein L,D-transpeptidase YafK